MSDHRFSYTVSGVTLSAEQEAAISREIAAAVTRVLIGPSAKALKTDFLTVTKIRGGMWLDPTSISHETVGALLQRAAG
jgi:hypothetical protein